MSDPLEDLIRQNNEFHNRLIEQNSELDRAFQSGTFVELVQSWSKDDDGGAELEGEAGSEVLGGEGGGAGREPETGSEAIQ